MTIKLLALDVDGTLLDSRGKLRPGVRGAVENAIRAGLQVVVCTGRRYRTALPVLEELALEGAAVLHNGVVVKDARTGGTLHSRYLPSSVYSEVLDLMADVGPPLVYVDTPLAHVDIVTEPPERAHPYQREYVEDNGEVTDFVESLEAAPPYEIVMLSCMADEGRLGPLERAIAERLGDRVRTNFIMNKNYRGHILEVVSADSGKWPALLEVAERHGVAADEIAAIGDDNNDAEMISGAGLGIAMGNAVAAVLDVADRIAPSNDDDGVVAAIEEYVL